jgi:putative intracellular protease/amidase
LPDDWIPRYDSAVNIAILLFDAVTALDAVGPYEVLSRLPGADVRFVGAVPGPQRTDNRFLALHADHALDDVTSADILVVPGGFGTRPLVRDERILGWIRDIDLTTRWTTSVCTGSLLLAAAGLIDGLEAATHWAARDDLRSLGAVPSERRMVEQGKFITAAGVSSGIDMALRLADIVSGPVVAQAIQLLIEYDPQPPFDTGAPEKASDEVRAKVHEMRLASPTANLLRTTI